MTHILSIDTSTSICSVALHQDGVLLGHSETFLDRSHSRNIAHMAEHVLAICEITASQLDAYAISAGPGSYTGMRIGTSTAKGFCFALNKPLISVSSLYTIAAQLEAKKPGLTYVPMIDARRMEVYTTIFNAHLEEIAKEEALILTEASFGERLCDEKLLFGGDGSRKFKEICISTHAFFAIETYPSAKYMGKKAFEKFQQNIFEDIAYFEPNYLKEFHTTSTYNT